MITLPNGNELRNLTEQVLKNKKDIEKHFQQSQVLADWGIRIIGRVDTWEIPTGVFEYGDAYAVGPEGGPFVFYIYTRGNPDYWFDYGAISIVGPQGPEGPKGDTGEKGTSTRWYVGSNEPTGNIQEGDMWLRVNNDGTTNGFVYQYLNNSWTLQTNIKGPQGNQGKDGKEGKQGPQGPQGIQGPPGNPSPIIDIIAELPEDTVISDIYSPSSVATNAGVLMPIDGVNHLWIIINGNWTDSGSWGQGGTKVYVDGEEVIEFDADTKLDKVSTNTGLYRVYGITAGGQQDIRIIATSDTSATDARIAAYRNVSSGTIQPGAYLVSRNPVQPYQVATKQYVDNKIAQEHGKLQHTVLEWFKGQPLQFQVDLGIYINPQMPSMPQKFQLYGIGGYVLNGGSYWSNGAGINELSFSMTDLTVSLYSYYPGSSNASTLGQFTINDYTLNGTVATFILTADDFGPEGGIFTFDCVPHSPQAI